MVSLLVWFYCLPVDRIVTIPWLWQSASLDNWMTFFLHFRIVDMDLRRGLVEVKTGKNGEPPKSFTFDAIYDWKCVTNLSTNQSINKRLWCTIIMPIAHQIQYELEPDQAWKISQIGEVAVWMDWQSQIGTFLD